MKKTIRYAGLVYYEEKGSEDLVTFTAAKKLNVLIEVYIFTIASCVILLL